MILRQGIACDTCNKNYVLRISLGHSSKQEHTFQCSECGEDLSINISLCQEKAAIEKIELINCTYCNKNVGEIVNLNPEVIFDPALRNQDFISPSLIAFQKMISSSKDKWHSLSSISEDEKTKAYYEAKFLFTLDDEWKPLQKAWKLFNRDKFDLAKEILEKNSKSIYHNNTNFIEAIFSFSFRCIAPSYNSKFEAILDLVSDEFRKNKEPYKKFFEYHNQYIFDNNLKKYYEIFKSFFEAYSEFSQAFLAHKKGEVVTEEYSYSSTNFEKTKKFYGDIFECFGSTMITFACLSNIIKGRKYETFEKLTLEQYNKLDKSGKGKCFSDIKEFQWLIEHYQSSLRNGSHHGTFQWVESEKAITYLPGRSNKVFKILYFDYINKCINLFFSCCVGLCVDIFIYKILAKEE